MLTWKNAKTTAPLISIRCLSFILEERVINQSLESNVYGYGKIIV